MKKIVLIMLLGFLVYGQQVVAATIKVGGYSFPPFVEVVKNKSVGITLDIIKEMNALQSKHKFEFVMTSPKRRYSDLGAGKFDLIMFEDINWGWKDKSVAASKVFLTGGEVYIAKADPSRSQSFFDDLKSKTLTVMLGFHYGFAGFNADEKYLKKNFKIQFNSNHVSNIDKVLADRADVSVVTLSFLKKVFKQDPQKKSKLLVSKKFDQKYNHTILVKNDSKISVGDVNALLDKMKKAGALGRVWKKYGLE